LCTSTAYAQATASLDEATALLQARRFAEAEAATRKVLAAKPRDADAHALLALILDQRGVQSEAEREYATALRLKPNLVSALSNFGVLLARTNRTAEAIAKFEEVLRLDPKHERAIFNLGALYAARGDYKRAVPLLEKAAGTPACKPNGDRALLLTLVNAYVHVERRDEALALSRCFEEMSAGDARALFTLGLSLAEAHEYGEAVRLFQRTNSLRPRTYEVLYNLGLALYNLDRLPEANFMIGEELLKNGLAEKSIPFYQRALDQSKGDLVYHLRLGVANVRGQRYQQAREIFTRALEKFPDNANLYFLLGYAARAEGQYDQAVAAFQKVVKLKRYDEAVPLLQRGIELNDKDPGIRYQLFLAYSRLRRKEEAEKELAEFKRLDEVNRHGATPLNRTTNMNTGGEKESLPPLPAAAAGDTAKPRTP
jgi:Flp pilus assembly protein TadD